MDKGSSSKQDRKGIVDERPGEIEDYSTEYRLRKIDQDKNPRQSGPGENGVSSALRHINPLFMCRPILA